MYCTRCGQVSKGTVKSPNHNKVVTCGNCGFQVYVTNKWTGEVQFAYEKGGSWYPLITPYGCDDPKLYWNMWVNEYLLCEGSDILVYSEGEPEKGSKKKRQQITLPDGTVSRRWVIRKYTGKTLTAINLAHTIHRYDESIIITNIPFVDDIYPDGILYSEYLDQMLYLGFQARMESGSNKQIILLIDEFTQLVNQHESGTKEGKVISKLLDLTRKFQGILVGITTTYEKFPLDFRRNTTTRLIKSGDRVLKLRYELGIKDLNPQNVLFAEVSNNLGTFDGYWTIGHCDWTQGDPPLYDHRGASTFRVSDWFIENRDNFTEILKGQGMAKVKKAYEFLGRYWGSGGQGARDARAEKEKKLSEKELYEQVILKIYDTLWNPDRGKLEPVNVRVRGSRDVHRMRITQVFLADLLGSSSSSLSRITSEMKADGRIPG